MTTRREFLELGAKSAAAVAVLGRGSLAHAAPVARMTYGVQMYEVRKQAATDLAGAFKSIKDAGFDQAELFPLVYQRPPAEVKKMLADAGLTAVSGHFDYDKLDLAVDYAHQVGLKYLVCAYLPQHDAIDDFKRAVDTFNRMGEAAKKAGIEFVFHNHDYEFKPQGATNGWITLMQGTHADLVKLELDVFWLTEAGKDPMEMLKAHADRTVLIHLKDRRPGAPRSFELNAAAAAAIAELGKGTIDFRALLKQAKEQGIRYAYLDQDETSLPVEESMKQARAYLRTLNL